MSNNLVSKKENYSYTPEPLYQWWQTSSTCAAVCCLLSLLFVSQNNAITTSVSYVLQESESGFLKFVLKGMKHQMINIADFGGCYYNTKAIINRV